MTSKPEVHISQLQDEIDAEFQKQKLHFRDLAFEWTQSVYCPANLSLRSEMGLVFTKPEVYVPDGIEVKYQRLHPHFRGQAPQWEQQEYQPMKSEVGNSSWRPQKRKYLYFSLYEIKSYKRNSNRQIYILWFNYSTGTVGILTD